MHVGNVMPRAHAQAAAAAKKAEAAEAAALQEQKAALALSHRPSNGVCQAFVLRLLSGFGLALVFTKTLFAGTD